MSPTTVLVELVVAATLLGMAAIGGAYLSRHPGPTILDLRAQALVAPDAGSRVLHELVVLGSLPVLLAGAGTVLVVGLVRDWVRALSCAIGAVFAVLAVQELVKPLVDRHIGTAPGSFPSGTVTAVAALATAVVLVAPTVLRPPAVVLGGAGIIGVGVAVVAFKWHYPTDALGGALIGVGTVLLFDALSHTPVVFTRVWRRRA